MYRQLQKLKRRKWLEMQGKTHVEEEGEQAYGEMNVVFHIVTWGNEEKQLK